MFLLRKTIKSFTYLLIFFLPLQTRWIYKLGILNGQWEYGTFSLYATEILLGLIIILSLIYLIAQLPHHPLPLAPSHQKRISVLFVILVLLVLNSLLAQLPALAWYKATQLILGASLFLIIILFCQFRTLTWVIIASASIQTIFAIQQFISQQLFANKWLGIAAQSPQDIGAPVIETTTRILRAFGTLPHPNILGGFLALTLLITLILYLQVDKKEQKLLSLLFAFNLIGLILTFSRSAILAFIISAIVLFAMNLRQKIITRHLLKFATCTLVIFVLFVLSYPSLFLTRLSPTNRVEQISTQARHIQYHQFWEIFQKNWLLGAGLGNYTVALYNQHPNLNHFDLQPIHNTFLLILAELGLPTTIILLIFIFLLFKKTSHPSLQLQGSSLTICPTCLTCLPRTELVLVLGLVCLISLDHYLWSFFFGILLIATISALLALNRRESRCSRPRRS